MNKLYYGDNLDILRRYIADESVDPVFTDSQFNSRRDYYIGVTGSSALRIASTMILCATLLIVGHLAAYSNGPKFLTEDHLKCSPCMPVYAPLDVTVSRLVSMLKKSKAKDVKVSDNEGFTAKLPLVECNDGYNEYVFQFSVDSVLIGVKITQHFKTSAEAESQHQNMCLLASKNFYSKKVKSGLRQQYSTECNAINYTTSLTIEVSDAKVIQTFMYWKNS